MGSKIIKKRIKELDFKVIMYVYSFYFVVVSILISFAVLLPILNIFYFTVIGAYVKEFTGLILQAVDFTAFDYSVLIIFFFSISIQFANSLYRYMWKLYRFYHKKRSYLTESQLDFISKKFIEYECD